METIFFTKVRLPYGWMGNMSPHRVRYLDRLWPTTEHLFQAMRFGDDRVFQDSIRQERSPMTAKMKARGRLSDMTIVPQSPSDVENMMTCLRLKIEQHPELREALLTTGDAILVEDVTNRQRGSALFWGAARNQDGSITGENVLGKCWMKLREEVRRQITGG